jgi:hypothetical protein
VAAAVPEFRASWSKLALKSVRRLAPAERDRVIAAIGEPTLATIRGAGVLAWLPADAHMRIADGVVEVLGETGAENFFRDLMLISFERPLIRPLLDGGLRIFGATPKSVLRMTPQAWSLVSRGCGAFSVEDGATPGSVRLRVDSVPPKVATLGFVAIVVGNCHAVLSRLRLEGQVARETSRLRRGSFHVDVIPHAPR